ncbi:MAG: hypothetical protein NZ551_12260 [Microscillaceae bacterium]|nr:hypothetical protein [Microscillaceae bacterium]MDW8461969.1 hypothetical protein [Cytophagales bacterium]
MIQTFTENDLLRYLYKETSPQENEAIEQWLTQDDTIEILFEELNEMCQLLELYYSTKLAEPSEECVQKILYHSQTHSLSLPSEQKQN